LAEVRRRRPRAPGAAALQRPGADRNDALAALPPARGEGPSAAGPGRRPCRPCTDRSRAPDGASPGGGPQAPRPATAPGGATLTEGADATTETRHLPRGVCGAAARRRRRRRAPVLAAAPPARRGPGTGVRGAAAAPSR